MLVAEQRAQPLADIWLGLRSTPECVRRLLRPATARLGAFKPSMLQDVEAGRPIELEALVGAPREIARRHDIATPQLDRIYTETRQLAVDLKLL